jgi:hypothetical protein
MTSRITSQLKEVKIDDENTRSHTREQIRAEAEIGGEIGVL